MDLFALAAVLYEMMEGEAPYQEETVVRVRETLYHSTLLSLTLFFRRVF
jgi:hypothetical protein